jgi:hypothetical protein
LSPKELPSSPRSLGVVTAERIATIIEAAEQAASGVIDDAEEQARHHIAEATAEANRIAAERLRAIADELDPPAPVAPERPERRLRPVGEVRPEPPAPMEAPPPSAPPRRSGSAGARLLATQMAVSGSSREEIEARLRSGFEIEDTSEILDAILGPKE